MRNLIYFFPAFLCALVIFSLFSSVPERASSPYDFKDAECRSIEGGWICFDTWRPLGFETGVPPVVYSFGDVSQENVVWRIFVRESPFFNVDWEASRLDKSAYGNVSVPESNVSVPYVPE